jgi:hypothetical protein
MKLSPELETIRDKIAPSDNDDQGISKTKNVLAKAFDKIVELKKRIQQTESKIESIASNHKKGKYDGVLLPYMPTSMTQFCAWEDKEDDLHSFDRPNFVAKDIGSTKALHAERKRLKIIAGDLTIDARKLIKIAKSGKKTKSKEEYKKECEKYKILTKELASQLAIFRTESYRDNLRIKSLKADKAKLLAEVADLNANKVSRFF